ncbi:MAG TPA: flagellar biosynthesis protein FlhF [Methylophaga aminisulfidivorans]|uniref:Flagellar biosynthesis protein FlhF n=2 Tax=Methylophaga TaxID=40222 RepID=F5T1Y6_9GAMM|nr:MULTISPECIES: flagellar biosynthesis protein FlhF [Methylophaga]EGL53396.1 flagellar GTP-binding protein [Methylophaga aminisulfidivorans MP]GLP99881.1 flagellar biosynthesis protein FlhF [Methylophaga thalassica]HIC46637.1 flagellar biosynthesis protein FlhF [Methylophaga sp.]HIM39240.1 flagellar biosynthesis protein FlhF [Methylophaga aminisulfidivorans]
MKIKRFQAADVRQAIREVRDVLGPDAVILSNTRVDGGIEIVAATDYDESQFRRQSQVDEAPQPHVSPRVEINPSLESNSFEPSQPAPKQNIWSQEPTLVQMRKEIAGLRNMLQNQLSDLTWKDMERQNPTQVQLLKRFMQMGIDVELAKSITAKIQGIDDLETAWRHCLGQLASQIHLTEEDILSQGGIYALVGPTGVGKTTTIAKLAARCALKHGARQVALITTDCYRIGGQEQLRTYARILGVPVRVARTHAELTETLNDLLDRRFILIDTAGMNQRDIKLTEKFAVIKQQSPRVKTYLTMSANTQTSAMDDIINAYSHLNLSGCILTKTDEASSLGGAVSALVRHRLPLAYIANGQQVPEDLSLARPNTLVNQASELMNDEQQLDPQTVSSYGGFAAYG